MNQLSMFLFMITLTDQLIMVLRRCPFQSMEVLDMTIIFTLTYLARNKVLIARLSNLQPEYQNKVWSQDQTDAITKGHVTDSAIIGTKFVADLTVLKSTSLRIPQIVVLSS